MNYTQKAEEILIHLFFHQKMTKRDWYDYLKLVNRNIGYGINALEHDLTKLLNKNGDRITFREINEKLCQMKQLQTLFIKRL